MTDTAALLDIAGVAHSFERWGHRVKALDEVTLRVDRGEWINLVGPNGSGKSTLLAAIAGKLRPQKGRVMIRGVDIATLSGRDIARSVFLIHQNPSKGTSPALTVLEHLLVADASENSAGATVPKKELW